MPPSPGILFSRMPTPLLTGVCDTTHTKLTLPLPTPSSVPGQRPPRVDGPTP